MSSHSSTSSVPAASAAPAAPAPAFRPPSGPSPRERFVAVRDRSALPIDAAAGSFTSGASIHVLELHEPLVLERPSWTRRSPQVPAQVLTLSDDAPGELALALAAKVISREQFEALGRVVGSYERPYHAFYATFEPFEQLDETGAVSGCYALISPEYYLTSVMDLSTGVIFSEEETYYDAERTRPGAGFCPTEFLVPDWREVHDGSILPDSPHWSPVRHSSPRGLSGFVAGCHWGDDSSWKLQHLDLSRVSEGVILRDDRFGYLELADSLHAGVRLDSYGELSVATELRFDLASGAVDPDQIEALTDPRWREFKRPGEAASPEAVTASGAPASSS